MTQTTGNPGTPQLADAAAHPVRRGLTQSLGIVIAVVCFGAGVAALAPARAGSAYTPAPMSDPPAAQSQARWLVDGFNVLHTAILRGRNRGGWWQEDGRRQLLERVGSFEEAGARLCVVFDGPRPTDASAGEACGPELIFAPSADDWLLREIRSSDDPGAITLVTADRPLADKARHHGARVVSPGAFLARCGA